MMSNKNFEYLGSSFQLQLLNQIIIDKDFSRSIIDVMEPNYFENKYVPRGTISPAPPLE